MAQKNKGIRIFLWSVALILLAGWIFQDDLFRALGESLVHEDVLRPAEAIVVLAGSSTGNRVRHAVSLWKKGFGKYLVFAGFERYPGQFSHDMMKDYAVSLGVPEENILTRKAVHEVSTWGEALDNLELMRQHGISKFIVVTTAWHTRRSFWIYKRRVEDAGGRMEFQVSPANDPRFPVDEWWQFRQGKKEIVIEYVKTLGFFLSIDGSGNFEAGAKMVSPYSTDITGRKPVPEGSQEDRSQSWDRVAFFLFCVGLLFMIFGSVQAVQAWPGVLGQVCILLACGVPALMALLVRLPDWLRTRRVPVVVFVAGGVLQVGLMVTGLSRDPASAFKGMVLFLVSGVCVLLSGYLLVRTRERLQTVMHLFTASFLVLCGYGMFEYYQSGLDTAHFKVNPVELFSNNPLPAGALLILLSMGPLCGWARSVGIAGKLGYGLVLLLGIAVIFLIGRKGPLIAMGAMALVYGWVRIKRFPDYLALGIVLAILSFPLWDSVISDRYLDRFNNAHSSLIRWENYFFGMSVLSNNFWSGVGFNGVYKEFVPDYQAVAYIDPKVPGYPRYKEFIWEHHTLENTWFSMLVETGVLFFTAYICLLAVSLRKAFQMGWQFICAHKERLVIALPVMGFMIEACTFDSLKFPNLNSVFHVSLVGFVGGISLSGSSALPDSNIPEPEAGSPALRKKTPVLKNSGLTGRDKGLWFGLSAIGALLAWLFYSSVPPAYFTEATLVVRPNLEYGPYNLEMYKTIADKESTRKEIIGRLGLRSPDGLGAMNVRQFESEFHPTSFFKITNKNNGGGQLVIQAKGPDPEITQAVCQAWADIMVAHGKRIHQEVAEVEISKRVVEVEVSEKNLIESRKKYDALKSKHSLELLQNEISTTSQMLAEARLRKERLESRLKKNRVVIAELDSSLNRGVQDPEMEQYVRHKKFRAELRVKILPKQILDFKNRVDHLSEKLSKLEAGKLDMETVSFALVQNLNSWNQIHNKDLINLDLIQRVFKGFPDEVEIVSGPEMPHGPVTSGILSKVMSGAFLGLVLGMMVSYVRKNFAGGNVRLSSELA